MAAAVNHAQFPAVYDQLDGDFFTKGDAARPGRCRSLRCRPRFWPYVETSGSEPAQRAFVAAYPGCQVQRALAEAKLASIRPVVSSAATPPPADVAAPQALTEDAPRDCGLAEAELQKLDRDDPEKVKAFANRWAVCAATAAEARGDARAYLGVSAAWTAVDRSSRLTLESFLLLYSGCAPQNAMAQERSAPRRPHKHRMRAHVSVSVRLAGR
ncbi:MAG: hypothetical protein Q8K08_13335 [Pseudotabrizicola sp.]|nr:hypothetical protein [Pseudotabrizicola sp.]